jgi:hypothetical protein
MALSVIKTLPVQNFERDAAIVSIVPDDPRARSGRLIVALAEAAQDLKIGTDALEQEASAIGLALDAMRRIAATAQLCAESLKERLDRPDENLDEAGRRPDEAVACQIARPLGLAASATLALNSSLTTSGNTLAEASMRVIYAGERLLEASRLAGEARRAQAQGKSEPGNAQDDVSALTLL